MNDFTKFKPYGVKRTCLAMKIINGLIERVAPETYLYDGVTFKTSTPPVPGDYIIRITDNVLCHETKSSFEQLYNTKEAA